MKPILKVRSEYMYTRDALWLITPELKTTIAANPNFFYKTALVKHYPALNPTRVHFGSFSSVSEILFL